MKKIKHILAGVAAVLATLSIVTVTAQTAEAATVYRYKHGAPGYDWMQAGELAVKINTNVVYNYGYGTPLADPNGTYYDFDARVCYTGYDGNMPGSLDAIRFRTTLYLGNGYTTPLGDTGAQTFNAIGDGVKRCVEFPIPRGAVGNGTLKFETHGTIIRSSAVDVGFDAPGEGSLRLNTLQPGVDPLY
jgi:hypothetical protein